MKKCKKNISLFLSVMFIAQCFVSISDLTSIKVLAAEAIANLSPVADTYITSGTSNFGAGSSMACKSTSLRIPYLKFDLIYLLV